MPRAPAAPPGHRLRVAAVIEWAKGLARGRGCPRGAGRGPARLGPLPGMAVLEHPGPAPLVALVVTTGLVALLWPPRRPENGWP